MSNFLSFKNTHSGPKSIYSFDIIIYSESSNSIVLQSIIILRAIFNF